MAEFFRLDNVCNIVAAVGAMVCLYWAVKLYLLTRVAGKLILAIAMAYGVVLRTYLCFIDSIKPNLVSDALSVFWIVLAVALWQLYRVIKKFTKLDR